VRGINEAAAEAIAERNNRITSRLPDGAPPWTDGFSVRAAAEVDFFHPVGHNHRDNFHAHTERHMATFNIDKAHSEAYFQIRHLITHVRGHFSDFSGVVDLNKDKPEESSVSFTVQASSIDTSEADRDNHLRSPDFFDVEKYPTLDFKSTAISKKSAEEYDVTGDLTIHGVTKQVTMPVSFMGFVQDPWGNQRAGFESETKINRKDFGLTWNAVLETGGLMMGDEIKISLSIQAVAAGS
jgi:polyisoprenoid-binding protein YceI